MVSRGEKPSVQAGRRVHETLAPAPGVRHGERVDQPNRDLLLDRAAQGPDPQRLRLSVADIARRLNEFERHYNEIAEPFGWNFTREKLNVRLYRLDNDRPAALPLAAWPGRNLRPTALRCSGAPAEPPDCRPSAAGEHLRRHAAKPQCRCRPGGFGLADRRPVLAWARIREHEKVRLTPRRV